MKTQSVVSAVIPVVARTEVVTTAIIGPRQDTTTCKVCGKVITEHKHIGRRMFILCDGRRVLNRA